MKATKKLIGAVVALIAALAVSVGATFAWFTTRQTASISGIEANVTTSDSSLEMKLVKANGDDIDGQEWGYELDLDGFFDKVKLDALTYDTDKEGLIKYGAQAKETTVIGDDGKLTSGSYVEFYIAFRSQDQLKIYLTSESQVSSVDNSARDTINAWKQLTSAEYGVDVAAGNPITAKAENAVRVGFAAGTEKGTLTGKGVWDPHAEQGCSAGTGNLAKDYEEYITDNVGGLTEKYTAEYSSEITANGKSNETALIAQTNTVAVADGSIDYYYAYVHVAMWIEGTDEDCFNNIFGDTVTLELHFEAAPVE